MMVEPASVISLVAALVKLFQVFSDFGRLGSDLPSNTLKESVRRLKNELDQVREYCRDNPDDTLMENVRRDERECQETLNKIQVLETQRSRRGFPRINNKQIKRELQEKIEQHYRALDRWQQVVQT
jgi:hypothetical protein